MAQQVMTKIRGLYTFPNDFSAVPEGSLAKADNIIIDRESVAEPRRGFTFLASTAGKASFATNERAERIFFYDETILCQTRTNDTNPALVYFDPSDGWHTNTATFNPPSADVKCQWATAKQNLYICTDIGVKRLDDRDATPVRVGIPEPLWLSLPIGGATTPIWLAPNYSVAYRFIICIKDEHGNLYQSAPSGREEYKNGNLANVSTFFYIYFAKTLSTNHFIQIYRSKQVNTDSPSDEMYLCQEFYLTSGEVSAGSKLIYDLLPDELLGTSLYTNETQQGGQSANLIPPKANDIAWYKDHLFYLNLDEQETFSLALKTTVGLVLYPAASPSTFTLDGITMTARQQSSGLYPASPYFNVDDTSATEEERVFYTARSLINKINIYCTNVYAVYASSQDGDPGNILIKSYAVGTTPFSVTCSVATPWIPPLPPSGTSQSSDSNPAPNGLACSKYLEPESVPITNRWPVGDKDSEGLRIIALRDSLFILKEYDGVWRLWGTNPDNFQIAALDTTIKLVAPDTAVALNNQIFALTTQGVVAISENGVTIMSRSIEEDILKPIKINLAVVKKHAFGIANESERSYYIYLPTTASDTRPTQYFRYNTITNNWTRGTLAKYCGGVNPVDDLMYLGDGSHQYLDVERKTNTIYDYCDYVATEIISQIVNKVVSVGLTGFEAGQVLYQQPDFSVANVFTGAGGGFDESNDQIVIASHGYYTGLKVTISINSGSFPAGLSAGIYYVIKVTDGVIQLAASWSDAIAGTAVDFTDKGGVLKIVTFTPTTTIQWAEIKSVTNSDITIAYDVPFYIGPVTIVAPIEADMQWNPITFGNPGINKHVRETAIMFLTDFYGSATVSFATDISPQKLYETITGSTPAPWGQFPWGGAPWGGQDRRRPVRVMVPRIHQRCSLMLTGFRHAVCFSPWKIQGISFVGTSLSEKVWHQGDTV